MKLMLHPLACTAIFIGLAFSNAAAQNCNAAFSFDGTDITIQFFDESTSDAGDPIVSWSWDFDDGTTSTEQNPEHTFPDADNYIVTLTITTQSGCISTVETEIEICVLNVSLDIGDCDASGEVSLVITVMDPYDAAIAVNISIDGQLLPGSPFDIDDNAPVTVNTSIAGDGLQHTLVVQSEGVGTCNETVVFSVPDCNSDCFLGSLSVSTAGGTTHIVDIGDNFFDPSTATIIIGDIVEFQWIGDGHTTTSDATSGPDSWNSGELSFGATYPVDITNPGVHPYYCIPHGGPGGVGMAGTIVANCPASGQFTLIIAFNTTQADPAGYNLIVDGNVQPGSPFSYNGTGQQSVQATLPGDGQQHTIEIQDVADPSCTISTTWLAPDCGAAPTCSLSVTATENGACNVSNEVPVDLTVDAINPGNSGFNVFVDGTPDPGNPYTYDASGTTNITIMLAGDGQSHNIEVTDLDDPACTASTAITTTDCSIPCSISNLNATSGSSVTHTVEVLDFDFAPANITITSGDIVEWVWVGAIDHTTTSDATSGPDSWDSGLLGTGATYQSPVLSTGVHPYYCIPHGAPGGTGMAGTITVQANCTNGLVSVNLTFAEQGGSANGFTVLVDGNAVGNYNYGPSGTTSVSVDVAGDGQSHTITVQDADNPNCATSTTITTPDCNASTCQLSATAMEAGGCNASNEVPVEVEVSDVGGSASGFSLSVDGANAGNYSYSGTGTTTITVNIAGDGQAHPIEVTDLEDSSCTATTSITTTDCSASCELTNLELSVQGGGNYAVREVEVTDFEFLPQDINIALGDTVRWVWTGAIPHTTTSDAASGLDSWDSGLLEQGATYELILQTPGVHPYYCTPHGGPGGIGMAGTITVEESGCENGQVTASMSFVYSTVGTQGYNLYLDGELQSGSPFDYGNSGNTIADVQLPGDGQEHILVVADAEDESCADTLILTTPNCTTDCQLSVELSQTGDCTAEDTVPYELIVSSANTGSSFDVLINGNPADSSPFDYDASGQTAISLSLPGDSSTIVVEVVDTDSTDCSTELAVITPDCTPDCSLEAKVVQSSNCDKEEQVGYQLTVVVANGSTTGFDAYLDGSLLVGSPFNYNGDTTIIGISLPGDGMEHEIIVSDEEDNLCADTLLVTTPDCAASCMLGEPVIEIGVAQTHIVDVLDFEFDPKDITVEVGDLIRWDWIGVVPHTVTSDVASGADSFNSGLLGQGAIFEHTVQEAGDHPYYCIPHGGPGGIGMAGTITAVEPCEDGLLDLSISFTANNTGVSGYNVFLDGTVTAGSPYNYAADGNNSFIIEVPGDGASHDLQVVDMDMPDCSVQISFIAPDCEDPCFGFEASFESELDHTNLTANFSSTTDNAVAWAWTFGDGSTSTEEAPSYTFSAEGHYEVCLTVTDVEGCTNTVCDSIFIGAYLCEPAFSFEGEGLDIQFTDESVTTDPITSWSWHLADGTMLSEEQHPLISFDALGIYELCLTIEAGDCMEDTCMTLDLSDPCLVFISDFSYEIDANTLSVQFTDLSTGNPDQWLWGFGDGSTSNEQHPTYTYQSAGTYNVCLLVQNTDLECNEAFCQLLDIGITGATEQLRGNRPLLIYPNPSAQYRHQWTIEGVLEIDYQRDILLRMYDAAGQLVFKRWTPGAEVMSINTGEPLSTGIYFVEMRSENAVYRARLVIQ